MQENKVVGYSWVIFAVVLATRTIASGLAWTCVPPFFTTIAAEMNLNAVQIGTAWGMIAIGTLLFVLIGGLISDRIGIRWAGCLGLVIMALGGAMRGFAHTYTEFLAAMFLFGVALGLAGPNFPRSLGQWFPSDRLGMVNGITMAGYGIGAALAMAMSVSVFGPLLGGWRNLMLFFALLTFILAIFWGLFVRERIIGERFVPSVAMVMKGLAFVLRLRSVWLLSINYMIMLGGYMAWAGHMPGFFEHNWGMSKALAGQIVSIGLFTALFAGIIGPTISDRIGLRKPILLWACVIGAVLSFIQGSFIGLPLIIIMILLPFGLGSIAPLVLTIPFELKELPQIAAGAAIGIIFTMGNLGGFIWPIVAGKLIDLFAPNYYPFFGLLALNFVVSLYLFWLLPETGPRTQKADTAAS